MTIEWLGKTQEQLRDLIIGLGVKPKNADSLAGQLARLSPQLQQDFQRYLDTGVASSSLSIEGFTLDRLMTQYKMHPVAAFTGMQGLLNNPSELAASLRKVHFVE